MYKYNIRSERLHVFRFLLVTSHPVQLRRCTEDMEKLYNGVTIVTVQYYIVIIV
jgi:hypothetical protein